MTFVEKRRQSSEHNQLCKYELSISSLYCCSCTFNIVLKFRGYFPDIVLIFQEGDISENRGDIVQIGVISLVFL